MLCSFFWVIPQRLNFMCRRFGTLCSIFIGGVSRNKTGWECWGICIGKGFAQISLRESEEGWTGRRRVRAEKEAVVGKGPKCKPVVSTLHSELFVRNLKRKDWKDEHSQFYLLFRRDMEQDSSQTMKSWLRVMKKRVLSTTLGVKEKVRREI